MNAISLVKDETFYPESDGEPVAETELHLDELVYVWQALKDRFKDDPDVFVGANMFFYYRKGDPEAVVAPDGFVVKGVPKLLAGGEPRRTYQLWNEGGHVPCFVLETTSGSTREKDKDKRKTYAALGVAEYFQFDPFREYLTPPLQGFRLVKGSYRPVRANPGGAILSQTLGVLFRAEGRRLRLTDAATGAVLLRNEEIVEKAAAEEVARRQAEKEAAAAEKKAAAAEEKAAAEALARRQAEEAAAAAEEKAAAADERSRALEEEIARLRRALGGG